MAPRSTQAFIIHESASPKDIQDAISACNITSWVYLGSDYEQLLQWQQRLGKDFHRISIAESLNEVAWEIRTHFVNWIDNISAPYGDSITWWTSFFSDKNTSVSPLFYNICLVKTALNLLQATSTPLLIVTECPTVARTLYDAASASGIRCHIPARILWCSIAKALKTAATIGACWARAIYHFIIRIRAARLSVKNARPLPKTDKIVLIHTFLDDESFQNSGTFKDRYFPGLAKWLKEQGYEPVILPYIFQNSRPIKNAYSWLRTCDQPIIIPEDYIHLKDIFFGSAILLRQTLLLKKAERFQNIKIDRFIRDLRFVQLRYADKIHFLAYIPMIKRLASSGFYPSLVIDKYENMPLEKPLVYAVKRQWPKASLKGYQHAAIPPFMLKYTTTNKEFENGLFPDEIISNGPWFSVRLMQDGIPSSRLRTGPTLRSQFLFSSDTTTRHSASSYKILSPLTLDPTPALELISKLLTAFEGTHYTVLLKPHPMANRKKLLKMMHLPDLPPNFKWVEGPIGDWIQSSDIMVAIGSASLMEAAAAGMPIVPVGRECGLDLSPISWFTSDFPEVAPVFSADALRNRVDQILSLPLDARKGLCSKLQNTIRQCYLPPNDETMRVFLP